MSATMHAAHAIDSVDGGAITVLFVGDKDAPYLDVRAHLEQRRAIHDPLTVDRARVSDAPERLAMGSFDVCVLDASSDPQAALAAIKLARARGWNRPIVVLVDVLDSETDASMRGAGVSDVLERSEITAPLLARVVRHGVATWRSEKRAEARFRALIDDSPGVVLAERMRSTGTLAAGVAHEINNPLAAILGNVEHVMSELSTKAAHTRENALDERREAEAKWLEELIEALVDARDGAERVRKIVRDLRTFALTDDDDQAEIDPRTVLDAALDMAENEIRHRAQLVRSYDEVPFIRANTARLGQVILNLLLNAAQAIPEGNAARNEIRVGLRHDGARVLITVRDSGPGILPEHVGRIFDPFFTTKPVGVGTGLGLSICHSVVKSLGGEIRVESVVGTGTLFEISFPRARQELVETTSPSSKQLRAAVARARILFVDDDAMIGKAMTRTLSKDHDVVLRQSAREALGLLLAGEIFDVVFCDVMMPEMTGMDFHAELLARLPRVAEQVVFLTGGAFTPRAVAFLQAVGNVRLEKPVSGGTLSAFIAERMRGQF
jgi:signal transduction histidine kinase/ActR/RegA family two-component response regulator